MTMVITFGYLYCFLAKYLFGVFFMENGWLLALTMTWVYKIVVSTRLFFSKGFEAKTYLLSVKRIAEFQQNQLESFDVYEKFHVDLANLPIEIQNVSLKYERKLLVLDKLCLKIPVFGKCAVVGSAGSGKHSLFSLILGLTSMESESFPENSDSNGNLQMGTADSQASLGPDAAFIKIFGREISGIDPFELRENILYLNQSPVIFFGKVRDNIDPNITFETNLIIKVLYYLKITEIWEKRENNRYTKSKPFEDPAGIDGANAFSPDINIDFSNNEIPGKSPYRYSNTDDVSDANCVLSRMEKMKRSKFDPRLGGKLPIPFGNEVAERIFLKAKNLWVEDEDERKTDSCG